MGLSRRSFLAASGAASVAAVAGGCGGDEKPEEREQERNAGDLEIVRFLLELEEVESAFYAQVDQRGGFAVAGARALAGVIARNEREHAGVLERWAKRLGGEKPKAPKTDLDTIFAAGPDEVLANAASLENLAAAAYLGQINRVQDRNLLASLLAIHTVEGRQAAALNRLAGRGFSIGGALEGATPDGAFAEPMEIDDVRVRLRRYTGGGS